MEKHNENIAGYVPGVCNIGKEEIRRRKFGAIFSGVLTIIFIILLQGIDVNRFWRLVVFIPAASFGIGILQWQLKFCVAFGTKGVFNFGNIGKTFNVEKEEYLKKDHRKAMWMIIAGILFGVIVAVIYYLLPG